MPLRIILICRYRLTGPSTTDSDTTGAVESSPQPSNMIKTKEICNNSKILSHERQSDNTSQICIEHSLPLQPNWLMASQTFMSAYQTILCWTRANCHLRPRRHKPAQKAGPQCQLHVAPASVTKKDYPLWRYYAIAPMTRLRQGDKAQLGGCSRCICQNVDSTTWTACQCPRRCKTKSTNGNKHPKQL